MSDVYVPRFAPRPRPLTFDSSCVRRCVAPPSPRRHLCHGAPAQTDRDTGSTVASPDRAAARPPPPQAASPSLPRRSLPPLPPDAASACWEGHHPSHPESGAAPHTRSSASPLRNPSQIYARTRHIRLMLAQRAFDLRQMMVAVPHRMILKHELAREWRISIERQRCRRVELMVAERPDRRRGRRTVLLE